ncbi:hypothetical protein ACJ41O_012507 [Fusarium nematophilum]
MSQWPCPFSQFPSPSSCERLVSLLFVHLNHSLSPHFSVLGTRRLSLTCVGLILFCWPRVLPTAVSVEAFDSLVPSAPNLPPPPNLSPFCWHRPPLPTRNAPSKPNRFNQRLDVVFTMQEQNQSAGQKTEDKSQQGVHVQQNPPPGLEIPAQNLYAASSSSPTVDINPNLFRRPTMPDGDNYFTGPRNLQRHSKWPLVMQMHGSIIPKLIMPLVLVAIWATAITVISKRVHKISVNSVLLTILGFVVGLSLSFRSSTAYERYAEGRRYWGQLTLACQTLGRIFWVHATEPEGQDSRELILKKIGAMNLLVAFAIALKHTLRFEPCAAQPDIQPYIAHLDTFIVRNRESGLDENFGTSRKPSFYKSAGEYLGLSFATSNPRKALKRAEQHQGNLPLEILNHIAVILDGMVANKQLPVVMHQTVSYNHLTTLNDVMTGCDRVLNTPLPIAYTIAISQITFIYVILLPFQLTGPLGWVAIPATVAAAYIIFGLLFIGQEIENPFGHDVNDLPLETYCDQIATDMDIIASHDKRGADAFLVSQDALPLYPVSGASGDAWMTRSDEKLRQAIKDKPRIMFEWRRGLKRERQGSSEDGSQRKGEASGADIV